LGLKKLSIKKDLNDIKRYNDDKVISFKLDRTKTLSFLLKSMDFNEKQQNEVLAQIETNKLYSEFNALVSESIKNDKLKFVENCLKD
jgi:hypothetical protein